MRLLFSILTVLSVACKHNSINNQVSNPQLICSQSLLASDTYYFKILDTSGGENLHPDTIVDQEAAASVSEVPVTEITKVNSKGCIEIKDTWSTVYLFDFNRHQGQILHLTSFEKAKIHQIKLEQISLDQADYEYRECKILPEATLIKDRMVYDLIDLSYRPIDFRKHRALFVQADDKARQLPISEGGCVTEEAGATGRILVSDGVQVMEYRAGGRVGDSEPYTYLYGAKSSTTVSAFETLFGASK